MASELEKVVWFLLGESPLDGVWFGEPHPTLMRPYWWRNNLRAAIEADRLAALDGGEKPKFTTGHCEQNKRPGGCQLHNLHCGWPHCDRKPITPPEGAKP